MWDRRVLVVHPPVSIARDFIDYPYFADLGAVQLAAVLREHGPVQLVDAHALPGSTLRWRDDDRAAIGATPAEVLEQVGDAPGAIVVALTPFHRPPRREELLGEVLRGLRARHPDVPILLADCYQSGQHYVDAEGSAVLGAYPEVDAWVKYESEATVPELLAGWFERGERPTGVHRGRTPDLDTMPFPAWGLVDLEAYERFQARFVEGLGRGRWAFPIDGRTLPLVTTRGCPFRCIHCSSNPEVAPGEPKTQRRVRPDRLRAYLRELVERHGATRLEALDELINVNERHFDTFLDEVEALDVRFDVPNGMRADYLEPRHLAAMRGRVETVSVSAESGAQDVVSAVVNKRLELDRIVAAARNARAAGVSLMIHYMIGLPGETAEQINATLELALELWERHGAWPAVQFATPLPGTELARQVEARRGTRLPVVSDWGPYFQKAASVSAAAVATEDLERFMASFEARLAAGLGPRRLNLAVTHACNNNCGFCALGPTSGSDRRRDDLLARIEEGRRRGAESLWLDGGEPTLHPQLIGAVRAARRLGYREIGVFTNGRRLGYEAYTHALLDAGLSRLTISLHAGTPEVHDRLVGVNGAHSQALAGIRQVRRLARPDLDFAVRMTITAANAEQQLRLAELVAGEGVQRLELGYVVPSGPGSAMRAPDLDVATRATAEVLRTWSERLEVLVLDLPPCLLPGFEEHVAVDVGRMIGRAMDAPLDAIDWSAWRSGRRRRAPECTSCPRATSCGGFVTLDEASPPWLVVPARLRTSMTPG